MCVRVCVCVCALVNFKLKLEMLASLFKLEFLKVEGQLQFSKVQFLKAGAQLQGCTFDTEVRKVENDGQQLEKAEQKLEHGEMHFQRTCRDCATSLVGICVLC